MPNIELHVNGKKYGGWKQAAVTRSVDAVSGKFDLELIDKWSAKAERWTIFPGDACQVLIDGVPMITGYVDRAAPQYDEGSHGIKITGRDKTADLVDCAAIVPANELRGLTLEGIAAAIANPFGIKVVAQVATGAAFPVFAIQPGETAWEAIERAARQRFMVVTTNGLGDLVIADIGAQRAADRLTEGDNIKAASAEYDHSQRFSEYIVKGQAAAQNDGWEPAQNAIESRAKDPNVKRYRPKIINAEMQASDGSAANRAELEAATRAGKSTKIGVTVQGWTMRDGALWPLNAIVAIKSPLLSVDAELLISGVTFSVDGSSGAIARLELTRPDAYRLGQGKAKRQKKAKDSAVTWDWELPG